MSKSKEKDLILLVGDTPAELSHLREVLVPEYNVEETSDGAEGFKRAKKLVPDLVIRDITVPGMDDTRWCKALKNDDETGLIPLLLLYCRGSDDCIVKGFECGVDDCIVRPFTVNILKARIKNLVDNRRQLLEKIWHRAMLQPAQVNGNSDVSELIEQLNGIIEDNLSNPLFTMEELRKKLCMSQPSMYRKIKALTGESPQMFIRSYRLKRAAQLLENNCGNVTEVCFRVGFTSTAYFAKCFKEKFHQSPRTFAGFPGRRWELETGGPRN